MADLLGQLLDLLACNVAFVQGQGRPARDDSSSVGFGAILEAIPISDSEADPIFSSIPMDVAEAVLRANADDHEKAEDATSKTPWLNAKAQPFYPLNVNAPEYVPMVPETDVSLATLSASLGVPTSELSKVTGGWWGNSMSGIRVNQWLSGDNAPRADDVERFPGTAASEEERTDPAALISAASLGSELGYLTHQYESQSSNWSGTLSCSDRSVSPSGLMDTTAKGQPSPFNPESGFSIVDPFAKTDLTSPLQPTLSPPSGVMDPITTDQRSLMASFPVPLPNDTRVTEFLPAGIPAGKRNVGNAYRSLGLDQVYAQLLSSNLTMGISGMEEVGYQMTEETVGYLCVDGTAGQLPFPQMEDALFDHQGQMAGNGEFYEEELLFQSGTDLSRGTSVMPKLKPLSECLLGKTPQDFYPAKKAGQKSSFVQEFHAALAQREVAPVTPPTGDIEIIADTGNQVDPVSDSILGVHTEQSPPKGNNCLILEQGPDEIGLAFMETHATDDNDSRKNLKEADDHQTELEMDDGDGEDKQGVSVTEKENFEIIEDLNESRKETRKEQFLRLFKEAFQF